MWTTTQHGYFSAVAHRDDPKGSTVLVRARDADDLRRVRDAGYETGRIHAMTSADYPYRVFMDKAEWGRYLADQAMAIDYTNFKTRIGNLDAKRAHVYMKVWSALQHIEDDDWDREMVPMVAADEEILYQEHLESLHGDPRKRPLQRY
jgi:hypothetical protein